MLLFISCFGHLYLQKFSFVQNRTMEIQHLVFRPVFCSVRLFIFRMSLTPSLLNLQVNTNETMKKALILLLLAGSYSANAQSPLKDALYGGKLKNEPGTVIRKGDDLSTKIDTVTRKPAAEEVAKAKTPDSTVKATEVPVAAVKPSDATVASNEAAPVTADSSAVADATTTTEVATPPAPPVPSAKDNNALFKAFMEDIASNLKSEVLSSKKVKKESYFIQVAYTIDTTGQTTVTDVFVSPENEFLQQQVKQRLAQDTPKLYPVLNSVGNPRKMNKKYNFSLVKE